MNLKKLVDNILPILDEIIKDKLSSNNDNKVSVTRTRQFKKTKSGDIYEAVVIYKKDGANLVDYTITLGGVVTTNTGEEFSVDELQPSLFYLSRRYADVISVANKSLKTLGKGYEISHLNDLVRNVPRYARLSGVIDFTDGTSSRLGVIVTTRDEDLTPKVAVTVDNKRIENAEVLYPEKKVA